MGVIAARGDGMEHSMEEKEIPAIPPKYRIREFLQAKFEEAGKESIAATGRFVVPDYSPESLRYLEEFHPKSTVQWQETLKLRSKLGLRNTQDWLWLLSMLPGWYFGEVLVRNLGGRWKYPNRGYFILALILFRPAILYRHWYVIVGKQKVPVFELAMRRGILGTDESLYRAYWLIAQGSFRNRPMGPKYASKP